MTGSVKVEVIPGQSWFSPTRYRLLEDVKVGHYKVPEGFVSDGLSVPRIFWPIVSPASAGFNASLVHDHALVQGMRWGPALTLFENALKRTKVGSFKRWVLVTAVKVYGFFAGKE